MHDPLTRCQVATSITCVCVVITMLIPFFEDLVNVDSSIGIFTLSFSIPPIMLLMYAGKSMKPARKTVDYAIIALSAAGVVLGVTAAIDNITTMWHTCDYKITL